MKALFYKVNLSEEASKSLPTRTHFHWGRRENPSRALVLYRDDLSLIPNTKVCSRNILSEEAGIFLNTAGVAQKNKNGTKHICKLGKPICVTSPLGDEAGPPSGGRMGNFPEAYLGVLDLGHKKCALFSQNTF